VGARLDHHRPRHRGCAYALSDGAALSAFVAGFLVCAALHRWIDAVTARKAEEEAA